MSDKLERVAPYAAQWGQAGFTRDRVACNAAVHDVEQKHDARRGGGINDLMWLAVVESEEYTFTKGVWRTCTDAKLGCWLRHIEYHVITGEGLALMAATMGHDMALALSQ